jgi:deoxyadenosine/deoxycytidine kinase
MIRIEICGGIASGKTTLASLLQQNNIGTVIYEDFQSNPFWKAFYENPGEYIFETEIAFTLQHYHEIKKAKSNITICDYSFFLDLAYANIGLSTNKLNIYQEILNELYADISHADLYIYLECPANEELHRIRDRNRSVENNIQSNFLEDLDSSLYSIISTSDANILKIDSLKYDFAHNPNDQQFILDIVSNKIDFLHNPAFRSW